MTNNEPNPYTTNFGTVADYLDEGISPDPVLYFDRDDDMLLLVNALHEDVVITTVLEDDVESVSVDAFGDDPYDPADYLTD